MLKRFLLAIGLVLLVSNSSLAQSTISCGMPVKSFDNSALAPNTDGVAYALYSNLLYITWQYDFTVDPSAVSMQLEASLDNLSWSVIDTSTTVTGAVRNVSGAYRFVRGHINTHTGGSGLTLTLNCTKQSGGSGGGGSGSGYSSIEEEGSALIARTALNFAGTGVTCADDTTKTTCTFTGGAASFPLLGTNGGISAPTYSFASDTDTGMYWSGPGSPDDSTLGFAVDGSSVFGVGNDGVLINGGVLNFEGATVDGTRTSLSVTDPTSNRSLVLPNASGNISLEPASIGFYVLTAAGAAPTARSFTSPTGTIIITNTDGLAGNVGIDVDTTTTVPYSSGVGDPPATCNPPELYYETDVFELSYCSDVNHWEFIITQSAQTDDAVIVGSGTGYGLKVLSNGPLNYATSSNTFSQAPGIIAHATDCTAVTTGIANDICIELDSERFFTCQPSAGGCDTAGEWILTPAAGGGSLPVADTTSIAEGSADNTKEVRFEVDGLTTGTVRVLTPPDADITIAGQDFANVMTQRNTFGSAVDAANAVDLNETAGRITFEGSTADDFETRLVVTNPTADRTVTFKDESGTVAWSNLANAFTGSSQTFSTGVTFNNSWSLAQGQSATWTSAGAISGRSTLTPDGWIIGVASTSDSVILAESADAAFDFNNGPCGTSACTDPTFNIYSHNQTTTQYMSLFHDASQGRISSGVGPVGLMGGAAVASAATIAATGNTFHVTGTTNIDTITALAAGTRITIIFDGILTVGDASNLKLSAALVTTADDTLTLVCDGTNWFEVARSVN